MIKDKVNLLDGEIKRADYLEEENTKLRADVYNLGQDYQVTIEGLHYLAVEHEELKADFIALNECDVDIILQQRDGLYIDCQKLKADIEKLGQEYGKVTLNNLKLLKANTELTNQYKRALVKVKGYRNDYKLAIEANRKLTNKIGRLESQPFIDAETISRLEGELSEVKHDYKMIQISDRQFGECIEYRDRLHHENKELKTEIDNLKFKFGEY